MFKAVACLILMVSVLSSSGQNTDIEGVINTYHPVSNISNFTLTIPSSSEFEINDLVLLIQMQGSEINESNSSDFGTIDNLMGVGNFEFVRICTIPSETEVTLISIENIYSSLGTTQLIKVPEYTNATVTDQVTAENWNGTTGGVIALSCTDTLTLNNNIDAQGLGFRGGQISTSDYFCSWFINVNDYFYDISSGEGAEKGEGIAHYIPGKTAGRGAQANGGGGGNDHNSGGGGGSNGGIGGQGGERLSPATFACSGSNPGLGGKMMDYDATPDKICLGGGGGSGHENNANTATSGSNGGGIVIIKANTIIGNNYSINTSGEEISINSEDGSGGGGSGGTVLLDVENYSGDLNLNISGSNGGDVSNVGSSNCNGPGGGGGGGILWFSNPELPENVSVNLLGGEAGTTLDATQDNCTIGSTNNATDGTNGLLKYNLDLGESQCEPEVFSTVYEICSPDSIFAQGAWQTEEGYYYDSIPSNCCSIITESILVHSIEYITNVNETLCFGDSLIINGTTYNTSIIDGIEIKEIDGACDSIWNINLLALPEISGSDIRNECGSYTWIDGIIYTEDNNSASFTIENGASNGCDSIVFLNLSLINIDSTITEESSSLTSNQESASYQWIDCNNDFQPILGAIDQSFSPEITGSYMVEISYENCTDSSACYIINIIGITENGTAQEIIVFPNPSSGKVTIDLGKHYENVKAILRRENGVTSDEFTFKNKKSFELNIQGPAGTYLLELILDHAENTTLVLQKF